MNKLYYMRNPHLFQGQKYLKKNKNYFEGWYFKNVSDNTNISIIPGISISEDAKKAFIQVITNDTSYFVEYAIEDFTYCRKPFSIQIKENTFSKEGIHLHIVDPNQNLIIDGNLRYSKNENIKTNAVYPNIMGPFSYVPFMECNHAILAMQNEIQGVIHINNEEIILDEGTGYIEKDWGCSFPKTYIWCQGNKFQNTKANFMCSIADIDFKAFHFQGLICVLMIDGKEYKFTTYNHAKIMTYETSCNSLHIILKKGSYYLEIEATSPKGLTLVAPVKGSMQKDILESICAIVKVTLKKGNTILFTDTSTDCGLEMVLR